MLALDQQADDELGGIELGGVGEEGWGSDGRAWWLLEKFSVDLVCIARHIMPKLIRRLSIYSRRRAAALTTVATIHIYAFCANAVAQQAIIGGYSCGTGCAISIEQLASPQRLGNGWSKVLVKETTREYGMNGKLVRKSSSTFWQFAKCDGDVIGKGFKSDGSDAVTSRIYSEEGLRLDCGSGCGAVYQKWEMLCNAPH